MSRVIGKVSAEKRLEAAGLARGRLDGGATTGVGGIVRYPAAGFEGGALVIAIGAKVDGLGKRCV